MKATLINEDYDKITHIWVGEIKIIDKNISTNYLFAQNNRSVPIRVMKLNEFDDIIETYFIHRRKCTCPRNTLAKRKCRHIIALEQLCPTKLL